MGCVRGRISEGAPAPESVPRCERVRSRGARIWAEAPPGGRERLETLREGGPRKREGGGARWEWGEVVFAEEGERVDILAGFVGILLLECVKVPEAGGDDAPFDVAVQHLREASS